VEVFTMWLITKNLIDADLFLEEKSPKLYRSADFDAEKFDSQPTVKFRLRDDDKEVYFEGLMTSKALHGFDHAAFAPLDDLGAGYGCTELQYLEEGKWLPL
jgi:hypothetical protein